MELGIIGLGVMGQSLALNAWEKGIQVHGFNRFDTFEDLRIRKSFEPTEIAASSDHGHFTMCCGNIGEGTKNINGHPRVPFVNIWQYANEIGDVCIDVDENAGVLNN